MNESPKFKIMADVMIKYPHVILARQREEMMKILNFSEYEDPLEARLWKNYDDKDIRMPKWVHFEPISYISIIPAFHEDDHPSATVTTFWKRHTGRPAYRDIKAQTVLYGIMFGENRRAIMQACYKIAERGEGYETKIVGCLSRGLKDKVTSCREDLSLYVSDMYKDVEDQDAAHKKLEEGLIDYVLTFLPKGT
jgi:hypothetical protein